MSDFIDETIALIVMKSTLTPLMIQSLRPTATPHSNPSCHAAKPCARSRRGGRRDLRPGHHRQRAPAPAQMLDMPDLALRTLTAYRTSFCASVRPSVSRYSFWLIQTNSCRGLRVRMSVTAAVAASDLFFGRSGRVVARPRRRVCSGPTLECRADFTPTP